MAKAVTVDQLRDFVAMYESPLSGKALADLANKLVPLMGLQKCEFARVRAMLERLVMTSDLVHDPSGRLRVPSDEERKLLRRRKGRRLAGIRKMHRRRLRRERVPAGNRAMISLLLVAVGSKSAHPESPQIPDGAGLVPPGWETFDPRAPGELRIRRKPISPAGGWDAFKADTPAWDTNLLDACFPSEAAVPVRVVSA